MLRRISPYLWCILFLLLVLVISTGVGAIFIPPLDILRILISKLPFTHISPDWNQTSETILIQIRLPRTVLVCLTGAALSSSGSAYQGLFRNPLADPYLIGVASGAGLGAILAMTFRFPVTILGFTLVPFAAFLGALITVVVVYFLARIGRSTPVTTLILAGIAVSAFTSSLTTFLLLRSQGELHRAVAFLVGGFSIGGWKPVLALLPYFVIGTVFLIALGRPLNVLQFGDDQAMQMGLNVEKVKLILILGASITTAAAVSFSGIIGFIGLAIPHLVRMIWGPDYRRLTPLAAIFGAAVLVAADTLARTIIAPQELPVGIITALAGAPFFLWLLRRAKKAAIW